MAPPSVDLRSGFLHVDPSLAGVAGNMWIAALCDAMGRSGRSTLVKKVARAFRRPGFAVEERETKRHGFRGYFVDATDLPLSTGALARETRRAARALKLTPPARAFADSVVDLIIEGESAVHGTPRAHTHLHEISGLDTAFDAVGTAAALDAWGFFAGERVVYSRPVEVGSGHVTFSHGTTPVPPPVSAWILHRYAIPFTQHADREVATPTGLAVLACLRPRFDPPPASVSSAIGAGAGKWELPDRPNLFSVGVRVAAPRLLSRPVHDPVAQVEASLDDVSGEAASHAVERVLEAGALDAHLVHTVGKKGRPGLLLLALARDEDAARIADVVAKETGSWGVRIAHRVERHKAVPRTVNVRFRLGGRTFSARVKVLRDGEHIARAKAEFDDIARAARAAGEPIENARAAAERAATAQGKDRRRRP